MKIDTAITKMINIDLPIIGAPMFLVSYPELVLAVSNAGGLGTFPALNYRTTAELKDALQEIRSKTNKPIGVNIILYKTHNPQWHEQLQVCLDEKVEVIIASLGTPKSIINEVHSTNAKIFCDVTTLKHARIVAKSGADALVAVAQGAGGHAGAISPFSLIPYLKKEIGLPVIAAGAISGGKQMVASLALGADAVYIGTRLIATTEATHTNQDYKQMIVDAKPEDIEFTDKVSGLPANWLRKSLPPLDEADDANQPSPLDTEYKKWKTIYSAGHGVAQIDEIQSATHIIQDMLQEYKNTVQTLPQIH